MSFFNFFNTKKGENPSFESLTASEKQIPSEKDVICKDANLSNDEHKDKPLTVSYATGWPIDIIYGYLHKNYESQGFEDAMLKNDLAFRDMNMNIIKNKILMVFREINLKYEALRHDLDNRIETCRVAGLLSTVSEMEKTRIIIQTHKEELKHLEEDFLNKTNEASIPLQSYDCGFLRGIATLALSITNKTIVSGSKTPDAK